MSSTNKPFHYAWWILIGCCLFNLAVLGIVNSCQGIFLIPVTNSLGISSSQFSLLITVVGLMGVISMPAAGQIIPRYSLKKVLGIAFLVFMGSFMALSLTGSYGAFLALGVPLGASGGFLMYIPVALLLGNWFKEKQGAVMGIAMAFVGLGGTLFNPLGSFFIQEFGWRNAYRFLGLIGLGLGLPAIFLIFKRHPRDMGMEPYGQSNGVEESEAYGMTFSEAARSMNLYTMLLWSLSIGVLGGVMYHLPAYAADLHYSAYTGSAVLSTFMFSATLGKLALGYCNDRFGPYSAIRIFLLMSAGGTLGLAMAGERLPLLFLGAFLFGQGMSLMLVETPILVRHVFGGRDYSAIYSVISMLANVTAMISVSVIGFARDLSGSYVPGFFLILIFPVTAWLGALLSIRWKKSFA